jgi:Uncharacterized protein conserved in bacteria (DUF2184)
MQASKVHSYIAPRNVRPFEMTKVTDAAVASLARIGLVFDSATVREQIFHLDRSGAFTKNVGDALFTAPATTPSLPTPIQFLQQWLPGFVKIMTAARKIDECIGVKTIGSWEDQEVVQGIVEPSATPMEYGDFTNVPLSSWNTNVERRTIVRAEMGIAVGLLEEGRAAAMRLNSAETKRQGAAIALEIFRNMVGFYGWNNGANRTFGLLNDPNLLPFVSSTVTGGWGDVTNGTFQGITGDIRAAVIALRTQSQDQIDPEKVDLTLLLPMNKVDYLSVTTDYGISVRDWITQTYKNMRIVSAPEFQGGNAGADCFYLFAEEIDSSIDGSTDGGETFIQLVQTKFMTLGVEKRAKSYVEDYANATAGTMVKRPWAVVRVTGI